MHFSIHNGTTYDRLHLVPQNEYSFATATPAVHRGIIVQRQQPGHDKGPIGMCPCDNTVLKRRCASCVQAWAAALDMARTGAKLWCTPRDLPVGFLEAKPERADDAKPHPLMAALTQSCGGVHVLCDYTHLRVRTHDDSDGPKRPNRSGSDSAA